MFVIREFVKQFGSNCYFSCNFKGYEEYSPTIEGNLVIQIPFPARYRLKIYAYIVVYEGASDGKTRVRIGVEKTVLASHLNKQ